MMIAIDGPAGTGKGTIAKLISDRLGFMYIDTGAMYRSITLKILREGISLDKLDSIKDLLERTVITFKTIENKQHVFLDEEDVTDFIRTPEINDTVSLVSAIPEIRVKMVELQRKLGESGNVIMEGRDITTVVFPHAELKIYLDASIEIRAMRRYKELIEKGNVVTYEDTLESIRKRDYNDMHKEMGALKIAEDAIVIDTSNLSIEEVYEAVVAKIPKNE